MNPELLDPGAFGPMFFSQGQQAFRAQAAGWDGDPATTTGVPPLEHASLNRMNVDPTTGTCDAEVLEPCDGGWLDIGGAPGTVVPARTV